MTASAVASGAAGTSGSNSGAGESITKAIEVVICTTASSKIIENVCVGVSESAWRWFRLSSCRSETFHSKNILYAIWINNKPAEIHCGKGVGYRVRFLDK